MAFETDEPTATIECGQCDERAQFYGNVPDHVTEPGGYLCRECLESVIDGMMYP